MSKGKILLYAGLLIIALILTIKHELLYYAYVQAKGQLEIVMNARQIEELIADPDFPESLKAKLKIIGDVYARSVGFAKLPRMTTLCISRRVYTIPNQNLEMKRFR